MYKREITNNFIDIKDEKGNVLFTMKEELSGETLIIGIAGSLGADTVYELEDEVLAALSVCNNSVCSNPICNRISFKNLVFDLSRINYISSSTLRSFLKIQGVIDKYDNMHMRVINPSESVMSRLEETGYIDILDIANDNSRSEE